MSYPDPRYLGDAGEIDASFRPANAAPDLVVSSRARRTGGRGTAFHYLATGASTRGEFGLYRVDMGPEVSGPSRHFHRTISESFFILSGTMRLLFAPGAPREEYFEVLPEKEAPVDLGPPFDASSARADRLFR